MLVSLGCSETGDPRKPVTYDCSNVFSSQVLQQKLVGVGVISVLYGGENWFEQEKVGQVGCST